jgi:hypothetical protein
MMWEFLSTNRSNNLLTMLAEFEVEKRGQKQYSQQTEPKRQKSWFYLSHPPFPPVIQEAWLCHWSLLTYTIPSIGEHEIPEISKLLWELSENYWTFLQKDAPACFTHSLKFIEGPQVKQWFSTFFHIMILVEIIFVQHVGIT